MRRNSLLILFLLLYSFYRLQGQAFVTDTATGISLYFEVTNNMFPEYWYTEKINPKASSLSVNERERVTNILRKAMNKYPVRVLKDNLKRIYALNTLNFFELSYGGTFSVSKKTVYITDDTVLYETDTFIESFFHHEFSSILLRKHPCFISRKYWKKLNPEGFHYGKGGIEAIRNGNSSMVFDSALNNKGFLNKYSQSSLDEDMNVFSQNLFSGGKMFWSIVDRYDKLKAKTLLIIGFYQKIAPLFTEEYFRKL